jgi:hypothetical protein
MPMSYPPNHAPIPIIRLPFCDAINNPTTRLPSSGSAQQHGSVYWAKGAGAVLEGLDASKTLAENLVGQFALEECPIWADSSTEV